MNGDMRCGSPMWRGWWGPRSDGRLFCGDGGLLGLHAVGWRAADAGAFAFQRAGVQPGAIGLAVRAL